MISKMKHYEWLVLGLMMNLFYSSGLKAQSADGGTQSPFSFGLEARAFSLGNAAVAFPQDASALYWNPAGMVVVEKKVVGLSMSTLFEGIQYHYAGIIMPSLSAGTFGIGVARIGVEGIPRTEWDQQTIHIMDEMNYWWGRANIAYGLEVFKGIALGVGLEVDRMVLGDWSANGFALHTGIHYSFPQKSGLLSGLNFGATFENVISPQLGLGTNKQTIPYNLRIGIAKLIKTGSMSRWLILADIEKPELAGMRYHVGTEITLGEVIALRAGINNGQLTFGCGINYQNISVDYGTGQLNDLGFLPWTHRFSLSFHMGPSIPEQRASIEEARNREIESRFHARLEQDRQRRIREGLQSAQNFLNEGNYFNARLKINAVLLDDSEHREALRLLSEIETKESTYQAEREAALLNAASQEEAKQRDIQYIRQRSAEANTALEKGDVRAAIEAWELALSRDPNHEIIRNNLGQARISLENLVSDLIQESRRLIRQEEMSEAYKRLETAKAQSQGNEALLVRVNNEIRVLDQEVDFLSNFQEGEKLFKRDDYKGALPYLNRALKYKPSHQTVKEMVQISQAALLGENRPMRDDVRVKFNQGIRLYSSKKYKEALSVWQDALELDPTDKTVLQAIRSVRLKIENYEEK